jgi:aerobic-type carbon monoxide dehydrogenase small subunit (CoxS/CutS family)
MSDREDHARGGPDFSRRDFLKGSGAAVAATALANAPAEAAQKTAAGGKLVKAEPAEVVLNVNGKDHKVKVEPRVTLLDVLRNDLNLTGCKDVCDTTNCGACTVHIDGKATYACSRLAHQCEGLKIVTVESLRSGEKVDPVVSGFVKHDAMQCGFCTPGFVMATRAFLDKNPKATLDDVRRGLGGNICRCGTYHGITACALELAKKGGE